MRKTGLAFFMLFILAGSAGAVWTLKFTERDTMGGYSNSYKDYANFSILVDGKAVASYGTLSGDYNYGRQTIDLTPYVTEGKSNLSIRLEGLRAGLLIYDIDVLHDEKPVRFTPWAFEKSDERVRGYNYSDTRLMLMLGEDLGEERINYAQFTTQPLADASELELNQSGLTFDKPIYEIKDGDVVGVNVTVRNIGAVDEGSAHVELYVNDAIQGKSPSFPLKSGQATTQSFTVKAVFAGRKFVKVEARAIPSDASLDGRQDDKHAVKYFLKRPSMFFSDISQTPVMRHWGEEPYTIWYSNLEYYAKECLGTDFSDVQIRETTRADCMAQMALYYQITKDERYAEKVRDGLTRIGDGKWVWADREKAGDAAVGSLDKGDDQNYGLNDVDGVAWGQVLLDDSLAYDWINDYSVKYDESHESNSTQIIRDRIARLTTDTYLLLKEVYSYGDVGTGVSAFPFGDYGTGRLAIEGPFGVAAMSILDYDGQYQDLDGSPDDWVGFVEKDLAVESQTGAKIPNLDQHMSREGLYEEGDGYRDYYEPSLSYFVGLYNNVLGVNMAKKYPIVDGTMKDIPLTMSPPGRYPNLCVSYAGVWYTPANSLLVYDKDSLERQLLNYYINSTLTVDKGYRQMGADYGAFNLLLTYDKSESHKVPAEPTFFSPNGSINVFRSGWDRNALYSFVKAPNEPTMSGHAPDHYHQLAFDIWAKGAYPIIDAGDERFLGYGGSSIYGHTTWLFYEDGGEKVIDRDTKGQYGMTCNNPAYVTSTFTSDDLDFLRGEMNVSIWLDDKGSGYVKNPFHVTRDIAMVGDEYFIVADTLTSNGTNQYAMVIPFGSANGHTDPNQDGRANWAIGNLTIDGARHEWYDYASMRPLQIMARNVSSLAWDTVTETNKIDTVEYPVKMTVSLNPSADVQVNVSGMHYGDYGIDHEWAFPYVQVKGSGEKVRYLTVYYPTTPKENVPEFMNVPVTGDGSATMISRTDGRDLVIAGDGQTIEAEEFKTDAGLTLARMKNEILRGLFLSDGRNLEYNGTTYLYSAKRIISNIKYGKDNLTMDVKAGSPTTIYLKTSFKPGWGLRTVIYNGTPQTYTYDGSILQIEAAGDGRLYAEASADALPNGIVNVPTVLPQENASPTTSSNEMTTRTTRKTIEPTVTQPGESETSTIVDSTPLLTLILVVPAALAIILIFAYFYSRKALK